MTPMCSICQRILDTAPHVPVVLDIAGVPIPTDVHERCLAAVRGHPVAEPAVRQAGLF